MSLGPYHDELYEQVLPMHGPDPDGLARDYVGACAHGVVEVDELVRDTEAGPGWGVILDVDDAPTKGLPWLAQLVGVKLRAPKGIPLPTIPNANGETGDTDGWTTGHEFGSPTTLVTATGLDGGGFHSAVTSVGSSGGAWDVIKPNAPSALLPANPGQTYGGSLAIHITHAIVDAPGHEFVLFFYVYDADLTLISTWLGGSAAIDSDDYIVGQTDTIKGSIQTPEGTAWLGVGLQLPSTFSGTGLDSQVDVGEAIVAPIETDDRFLTPDWPYQPGTRPETDEEWAVYARDAIRRQGGKNRGTPDAMRSAIEDTLLGTTPYVNILERVGGNAYALTVVTRPSETPDPDATYAAALAQKPLGMALTHTLTEGVLIDEGTKTIDTASATIDTATLPDVAD